MNARELRQLIGFVADKMYPDELPKARRNKVRNRVRYAMEKTKDLEKTQQLDTGAFFGWAVKKWPALLSVPDLPVHVQVHPRNGTFVSKTEDVTSSFVGVSFPKIGPDEAVARYPELMLRIHYLETELKASVSLNADLRRRLEPYEDAAKKRHQTAVANGKKGGRPRGQNSH